EDPDHGGFVFPIINVALDNMSYDGMAASETNLQRCTGIYNIDCYGFGVSVDTDDGHDPGDEKAAKEAHRAFRLVREMLMSGYYKYLRLRGLVGKRSIQSVTEFQPVIDSRPIQRVMGVRITLAVDFVETSQQFEGEAMDLLSVNVIQARSEEHTSELQSRENLVCRLLLEKKKKKKEQRYHSINTMNKNDKRKIKQSHICMTADASD